MQWTSSYTNPATKRQLVSDWKHLQVSDWKHQCTILPPSTVWATPCVAVNTRVQPTCYMLRMLQPSHSLRVESCNCISILNQPFICQFATQEQSPLLQERITIMMQLLDWAQSDALIQQQNVPLSNALELPSAPPLPAATAPP